MSTAIIEEISSEKPSGRFASAEELGTLLSSCEFHPYQAYEELIPPAAVRSWQADRASELARLPAERRAMVGERGRLTGAAFWTPLPWDSRHFGFPAARLEALAAEGSPDEAYSRKLNLLMQALESSSRAGIRHLSVRVDAADLTSIRACQAAGFELVDGIQTFAIRPGKAPLREDSQSDTQVGLFSPWQLEGVLEIARSSYKLDRFHSDPALTQEIADHLHEDWVRNSCLGSAADSVFVACQGTRVAGFVTVKVDHDMTRRSGAKLATIVLVAIANHARGKGVGRQLTLTSLRWLAAVNTALVQVGTQLRNIPAARLYESCGFRTAGASLTFRSFRDGSKPGEKP